MAVKTISLSSQYRLRLTVNVKSQNQSAKTTTCSYSLQIIKASGYGYYSYQTASYTVRSPYSNTFRSGTISGYDFRNYTTLTLASGTVTTGQTGSTEFAGVFADNGGGVGSGTARLNLSIPGFSSSPPPQPPSNLSATRQSDKSIRVTWNRPGVYSAGLQAQRSTGDGKWAQIARPGG